MKKGEAPQQWRPATENDLISVDRIGNAIHVQLIERANVFAEKFRLFPEGCYVLVQHDEIAGYGLSHPWLRYEVPPLDTFLRVLPPSPDCIYVHDVVVLPQARGQGAAGVYLEKMVAVARSRQLQFLALVSVYNTHPLWAGYGFESVSTASLATKLQSYGPTATYMVRRLS